MTQPNTAVDNYQNKIRIGQTVTPGEIVLEAGNDYELFNDGAENIPAITDVKFATITDGDMTIANVDKIGVYNGIIISNTSSQITIKIPSESIS